MMIERINCERCFYLTDPKCPKIRHVCSLETGLKKPNEKRWIEKNLSHRIKMRKDTLNARAKEI